MISVKTRGEKFLWAAKAPATATDSIRRPLPASAIAWTCDISIAKVRSSQGTASPCAARGQVGRPGLHPLCGDRGRETGKRDPDLPPPERSRRQMGRGKGDSVPCLDGLQLRRGEDLVHLSRSGLRQEGCGSVRSWALLPVSPLLRAPLREPAGERDVPRHPQGTIHPQTAWGQR